jgi:pilus assembly protein CpaE
MASSPVRGILISTDAALHEALTGYARGSGGAFALLQSFSVGLDALSGTQFKTIHQAAPALVFVDFDSSVDLAVSLARDLVKASPNLVIVGVGATLDSSVLLQAMRAGLSEYLTKPVTPPILAEGIERLLPRVTPAGEPGRTLGKTLAFFSAKGGSGTSTAVTNLAIEIHRLTGESTLVVDLDAELGEVALLLGMKPQFNFVDLVKNFHRVDADLLASYIEQHETGVHLLSAPFHPEKATELTKDQIRQILQYLGGHYRYVLIDTPRSFSPETIAAFEHADEVFLITTVDLPSLRNVQRAVPLLNRVMQGGPEQLHLIVNRHEANHEVTLKDVERSLGLPVYGTLANDFEAVIRSVNSGKPVVHNDGRSPYTRDIRSLAGRITQAKAETTTQHEKRGFLGRLFHGRSKTARAEGSTS